LESRHKSVQEFVRTPDAWNETKSGIDDAVSRVLGRLMDAK